MTLRSKFFDLFGSCETELPHAKTLRVVSSLETVSAEVKVSLHDGEPPCIHIDMVGADGRVFYRLGMNRAALDAHINTLIKHRDLLAQMGKHEGDSAGG